MRLLLEGTFTFSDTFFYIFNIVVYLFETFERCSKSVPVEISLNFSRSGGISDAVLKECFDASVPETLPRFPLKK